MRRWTWWGTTAVVWCGLGWGLVQAADRDTYQSASAAAKEAKERAAAERKAMASTWSWWPFGSKPSLTEQAEQAARKSADEKKNSTVIRGGSVRTETEVAALMLREKAKFDRRQEVCDRLREIAHETGDAQLERQADLLEQRAWFVYEQRANLGRMQSLVPSDVSPLAAAKPGATRVGAAKSTSDRPLRSISSKSQDHAGEED